ncbi:hypothetical protein OROMI_008756 [Orobanche minor]
MMLTILVSGPHEPGNDLDGYMGCPICGDETVGKYLSHSRKMCYLGHRRYLPRNHPYRRQKSAFNGEQELGQARPPLSGEEVLSQQERIRFHSIGTLLNMKYKTKDSEASRLDMIDMGVRTKLAPQKGEKKTYLPPSSFNLSRAEKKKMLSSLMNMKLPYGHASNIKNCVSMDELKMFGMKSHDCHILLQQLLPLAIRDVLQRNVRVTIIRLCFFFNALCSKIVDASKLDKLQADVIVTLCELEKIFPASFFDILIHLTVHLVHEVRLCGPVFYRWMYASERFNKVLKSYVRNRYYPKGCIAESYLGEESIEFCQKFLDESCTTAGLRKDAGKLSGPLSVVTMKCIEENERDEAHLHALLNNPEVHPYILMHKEYLERIHKGKKITAHWLLREHNRLFADWFERKVSSQMKNGEQVSETIRWLAGKPSFSVLTYDDLVPLMVQDDECVPTQPIPPENKGMRKCELAVDTIENKVAFGLVFDDEELNKFIHGVPLPPGCARVSVDGPIKGDALIPIPIAGEIETVDQAVGSYVSWPRELIIVQNAPPVAKSKRKAKEQNNELQTVQSVFKNMEINKNVPQRFRLLYKHATTFMKSTGNSIQIPCDAEVFGVEKMILILHENVIDLLEFKVIGQAAISSYMAYLHSVVHENENLDMFAFCDPGVAFNPDSRFETYLINRMKEGNPDRLFFLPVNKNYHWILILIWAGEILFLNPLPRSYSFPELEKAISRALIACNIEAGRGNKAPAVKYISGCPKQSGNFEYGYVVMRYMKEIAMDNEMSFLKKWTAAKNRKQICSRAELDEVRFETLTI